MALGRVTDVKWIHEGKVYIGGFCTAQGESIIQKSLTNLLNLRRRRHSTARRDGLSIGYSGASINISAVCAKNDLITVIKAIAVHTFVVVLWGIRPAQHAIAYAIVGLTWMFVVLFVVLGVAIHTHGSNYYETPVGVSLFLPVRYATVKLKCIVCGDSTGVGSAISSKPNNMPVNTFGFGPRCSYAS